MDNSRITDISLLLHTVPYSMTEMNIRVLFGWKNIPQSSPRRKLALFHCSLNSSFHFICFSPVYLQIQSKLWMFTPWRYFRDVMWRINPIPWEISRKGMHQIGQEIGARYLPSYPCFLQICGHRWYLRY